MRLNRSWILIAMALFALGFKFPGASQNQKKNAKQTVKAQPAAPARSAAVQPSKAAPQAVDEGEDEGGEETNTLPRVPSGLPKIPKVAGQQEVRGIRLNAGTTAASEAAQPAKDILKTQKQIRDILRLNESLKARYKTQATEIQKISEQAKIHQKILQDLESAKKGGNPNVAVTPGKGKTALEEQKIRLIQQETDQQHKFIKKLEEGTPPAEARKEAGVKASEAKVQ